MNTIARKRKLPILKLYGVALDCFFFPLVNLRFAKKSLVKTFGAHAVVVFTWSFVQPFLQKNLIDYIVKHNLLMLFFVALIAMLVYSAMHRLAWYVSISSIKIRSALRRVLSDKALSSMYAEELFREKKRSSKLISRLTSEPAQLSQLVQFDLEIVGILLSAFFSLALCAVVSWYAVIPFLAIVPIIIPLSLRKARITRTAAHRNQQLMAKSTGFIASSIEALDIFSAFKLLPQVRRAVRQEIKQQQASEIDLGTVQSKVARDTRIIMMIVELIIFIAVGVFVVMTNASLGSFFALTAAYWRLTDSFKSIVDKLPAVLVNRGLIARFERFCMRGKSKWYVRSNERNGLYALELSGVIFSLGGLANKVGPVNALIEKSGTLAIFGVNGSGKTTLLRILAGGAIAHKGKIFCPTPLSVAFSPPQFPPISCVKLLGLDDQDAASHIRIRDLASRLGIQEKLCEVPINWSDGEKRRLGILLALSKEAEVYILDEPFSGIDMDSKRDVLELIFSETKNSILVVSLHEAEFLHRFDKVIDMRSPELGKSRNFSASPWVTRAGA